MTPLYSETQRGSNGLRYREWLSVFASPQTIEKVRLDAHILDLTTSYHQAIHPWRRAGSSPEVVESVLVRSSLPLEQRVLHERGPSQPTRSSLPLEQRGPSQPTTRFASFVRSCKARLTQDLKALPVRGDPSTTTIKRSNTSFYENERANQILLVYAPESTGSSQQHQFEFICMTLLPPSHPGASKQNQ